MKKSITLFFILLCLCGCKRFNPEDHLLPREDISLTVKGEVMLTYDPMTFQLGCNEEMNEFRVFDDNVGNWFTLKCKGRPVIVGDVVSADLIWTTENSTKTRRDLIFSIEKTDSEGKIWLWCKEESIGVVVKAF